MGMVWFRSACLFRSYTAKVLFYGPVGVWLVGGPARSEVGVSHRSILIGQSAAFSGTAGLLGSEFREGAHQVFDQVNAQGGVHGRQIVMV